MVINEALDHEDRDEIVMALGNPNACLVQLEESSSDRYVPCLIAAKKEKTAHCVDQVGGGMCVSVCVRACV